jgi:hypothetical protein
MTVPVVHRFDAGPVGSGQQHRQRARKRFNVVPHITQRLPENRGHLRLAPVVGEERRQWGQTLQLLPLAAGAGPVRRTGIELVLGHEHTRFLRRKRYRDDVFA